MSDVVLKIDGAVPAAVELRWDDLRGLAAADQVPDVSVLNPKARGAGVRLSAVLSHVAADPSATQLTLRSTSDGFTATLPIGEARDRAVLIHSIDGQPLRSENGGPIRFFIPDAASCKTADVDTCANVKHLDHIQISK